MRVGFEFDGDAVVVVVRELDVLLVYELLFWALRVVAGRGVAGKDCFSGTSSVSYVSTVSTHTMNSSTLMLRS